MDTFIFATAISKLGVSLNIDFFASRLIIFRYSCMHVSFKPDPGAIAINAFHMSWKPCLSYVFRPFCLISRILQKIQKEKATVIAVVPHWPTQIIREFQLQLPILSSVRGGTGQLNNINLKSACQ